MLGEWYQKFWFATEFYLTPVNRRPYTFIMRDWIFTHPVLASVLIFLFYAGMIVLSIWHGTASTITTSVGSFLLAHLVWGSKYIEQEQEFPEYLGE